MIIVAVKACCHCGVVIVFYVKYVTLESINDSVFCFSYIFNMAPVTFHAIYQVITLASAFCYYVVGLFLVLPDWEFFLQYYAGIVSLAGLISSGSWLSNFHPYQHISKGRWLPLSNHEVLFSQLSCGTRFA